MRKLILPFTLLILLFSCRTGELRKEPWQEGMTVVTGLFELELPSSGVTLELFFKNNSTKFTYKVVTEYDINEKLFYLLDTTIPAGNYTFYSAVFNGYSSIDGERKPHTRTFDFKYSFVIRGKQINNLGVVTLTEELRNKITVDSCIFNKDYSLVDSYYSDYFAEKELKEFYRHKVEVTEGEPVDWSHLFENLPDKAVHNFEELEVTYSYHAEAVADEPIGLTVSTMGKASAVISNIDILPAMEITPISYTSSVKNEGMSSEAKTFRSFKLVSTAPGIYTIDCIVVYRDRKYSIPPIAITVKENSNDND